jgi:hypothetical protein
MLETRNRMMTTGRDGFRDENKNRTEEPEEWHASAVFPNTVPIDNPAQSMSIPSPPEPPEELPNLM